MKGGGRAEEARRLYHLLEKGTPPTPPYPDDESQPCSQVDLSHHLSFAQGSLLGPFTVEKSHLTVCRPLFNPPLEPNPCAIATCSCGFACLSLSFNLLFWIRLDRPRIHFFGLPHPLHFGWTGSTLRSMPKPMLTPRPHPLSLRLPGPLLCVD